jgi:uncharacterized protein (TIGR02246 family)
MKNITLLYGVAGLALLLTGCSQTSTEATAPDGRALRDLEAQWNQDYLSKDPEKLVAHYADDAVLMAPAMPASVGKDAIRKTMTEMLKDPALSLKFAPSRVEMAKSGDVGYTQGSYTMTMTDPNSKQVINDHGSYVTTYRKAADGSWKAVMDIATSEVPPPAPATSAKK